MGKAEFFYKNANAPKPNKPNHIGTNIIITVGDRVLLERRTDSDCWAFIGGGLKIDETLLEGILRETLEETGINLNPYEVELYKIYDDPSRIAKYPDGNVVRIITAVYKINLLTEPVLKCSEESRELRFFTKDEVRELEIAKTHIPIAEDYYK